MSWMLTSAGAESHRAAPAALAPCCRPAGISDVAHHQAIAAQLHGTTSRRYSASNNGLLCGDIACHAEVSESKQLPALVHDARETYANNVRSLATTAVSKHAMAGSNVPAWNLFKMEHTKNVRAHCGLLKASPTHHLSRCKADLHALATQRRDPTRYNPECNSLWAVRRDKATPSEGLQRAQLNATAHAQKIWRDRRADFRQRSTVLKVGFDAKHSLTTPTS